MLQNADKNLPLSLIRHRASCNGKFLGPSFSGWPFLWGYLFFYQFVPGRDNACRERLLEM